MPKFDPIASLGIWAVEVELAGRILRIPPLPAGEWLPYLLRLDLMGLRRLTEDIGLRRMLLDGTVTYAELEEALTLLLEAAAGRSMWCTLALASVAADHWHVVGGTLARRGVRLETLPLGAALDAIYGTLTANMDEKSLAQFHAVLDRSGPEATAPPRRTAPVPASAERYVRERPRTVQRKPQDRPGAPSASPTPPPELPVDSAPADVSASPETAE